MDYRLSEYSTCWSLFQDLLGEFDLRKILKWDRNQGLYFEDQQTGIKHELEEIKKPVEILERLLPVLTAHQEFKTSGSAEKVKKPATKKSCKLKKDRLP